MDFGAYINFLQNIFAVIPFNVFDYLLIIALLIYVFEDASFGIMAAGISFGAIIAAFFLGLILYHPLSALIVDIFSLPKGISDAIAFLLITGISFVVISLAASFARRKYLNITFPRQLDMAGGAIFGALSFFFIASFVVALLLSFPLAEVIKDSVRNSVIGSFLNSRTQLIETNVRNVFTGAIDDTINFLTVKPDSGKSINLNFTTRNYSDDPESEAEMLELVNRERVSRGLNSLSDDPESQAVAREHARDMLERGYFSHYTPEGLSPFARIEAGNVGYQYAGENLALAPDANFAMNGLMKSEGHRANILSENYGRAGIGVIDAGIYGKMFVQIFRD